MCESYSDYTMAVVVVVSCESNQRVFLFVQIRMKILFKFWSTCTCLKNFRSAKEKKKNGVCGWYRHDLLFEFFLFWAPREALICNDHLRFIRQRRIGSTTSAFSVDIWQCCKIFTFTVGRGWFCTDWNKYVLATLSSSFIHKFIITIYR